MQDVTLTQADRKLKVLGHNVALYERGESGPCVLFLHGIPDHAQIFLPLMQRLADRAHCLAVDLPGFGCSTFLGPGCYHQEQLTMWIEALGEVLALRDAVIVVTDVSGMYGIPWAVDRPERVAAMVVLNTTLWPEDDHPPALLLPFMWPGIRHVLLPWQKLLMRRPLFAPQVASLFWRQPRLPRERLDLFWHQFEHGAAKAAFFDWLLHFPANKSWLRAQHKKLPRYDRPVRLVWGTHDPIYASTTIQRFRTQWPQASPAALIEAGHYPQYEAVDEVAVAVRGLLETLGR